jgi:hypothetical protein
MGQLGSWLALSALSVDTEGGVRPAGACSEVDGGEEPTSLSGGSGWSRNEEEGGDRAVCPAARWAALTEMLAVAG